MTRATLTSNMEIVCYTLTRIRRQLKITKNTKEVGIKTNGTSCYEEIASNISNGFLVMQITVLCNSIATIFYLEVISSKVLQSPS
jgi:hypothetical protein